jgi:hypothetical protein
MQCVTGSNGDISHEYMYSLDVLLMKNDSELQTILLSK